MSQLSTADSTHKRKSEVSADAANGFDASTSGAEPVNKCARTSIADEEPQHAATSHVIVSPESMRGQGPLTSPLTRLPNVLLHLIGTFLVMVHARWEPFDYQSDVSINRCIWSVSRAWKTQLPSAVDHMTRLLADSFRWAQQLNHRTCHFLPEPDDITVITAEVGGLPIADPLRNLHMPRMGVPTLKSEQRITALERGWTLYLKEQHPTVFANLTQRIASFRADIDAYILYDDAQPQRVTNKGWFDGIYVKVCRMHTPPGRDVSPVTALWQLVRFRSPSGSGTYAYDIQDYIMTMYWCMAVHFGSDVAWTTLSWTLFVGIGTDFWSTPTSSMLANCRRIGFAFHPFVGVAAEHAIDITHADAQAQAETHLGQHVRMTRYPRAQEFGYEAKRRIDCAPLHPQHLVEPDTSHSFGGMYLALYSVIATLSRARESKRAANERAKERAAARSHSPAGPDGSNVVPCDLGLCASTCECDKYFT